MDGIATGQVEGPCRAALRALHRHLDTVESRLRLATDAPDTGTLLALHEDTARLHVATSGLDTPWAGSLATLLSALRSAGRSRQVPALPCRQDCWLRPSAQEKSCHHRCIPAQFR